jgi:hypothetical protein
MEYEIRQKSMKINNTHMLVNKFSSLKWIHYGKISKAVKNSLNNLSDLYPGPTPFSF